jgi:hypothetical protein
MGIAQKPKGAPDDAMPALALDGETMVFFDGLFRAALEVSTLLDGAGIKKHDLCGCESCKIREAEKAALGDTSLPKPNVDIVGRA